jgi:hypothetical protein
MVIYSYYLFSWDCLLFDIIVGYYWSLTYIILTHINLLIYIIITFNYIFIKIF